jgi:hypothetical protein
MAFPERAKAHIWGDISKMSEDPGRFAKNPNADFTRNRKLDFEKLLRLLISMQSDTTALELLKFFDYCTDTLSISAFYQQRQKLLPTALPFLLRQFNSHFPLALYKGIYNLVGCDGCEFNIARNPDDTSSFHPPDASSKRGFNSLHAVALFDLLGKTYLDCVFQPGMEKNEFRAICDLADRYSYGGAPIFIADRGFSCYNFFAHAMEKGFFFLVRTKEINAKRILLLQSLPPHIDIGTELILTRTQSKKLRMRPDMAMQYRYISQEVAFDFIQHGSPDEYPLRLRIVRFEVAEGVYENIVTNLPNDITADEIKYLYNLRWGIETSFRDLKHTIGATNFHSKKVEYIEQEIWARLILFNFCSIIAAHVVIVKGDHKHTYQVNFAMAIKICHHFIRLRAGEPPPDVEALIGMHLLPIRLGRTFARQRRFQPPASFCYRFS